MAQICHINAASVGGERYNPDISDENLREPDNLLILCYAHHIETNDVIEYPVERLQEIKATHESHYAPMEFSIPKIALEEALAQENSYWKSVHSANTVDHIFEELKFNIDPDATFYGATQQLRNSISSFTSVPLTMPRVKAGLD